MHQGTSPVGTRDAQSEASATGLTASQRLGGRLPAHVAGVMEQQVER